MGAVRSDAVIDQWITPSANMTVGVLGLSAWAGPAVGITAAARATRKAPAIVPAKRSMSHDDPLEGVVGPSCVN